MYPDNAPRGVGEVPNGKEFPNRKEARQIQREVTGYLEREAGGRGANLTRSQLFKKQNADRRDMGLPEIPRKKFEKITKQRGQMYS